MDRAMSEPRLVALLCRTSDRGPEGAAGAEALAAKSPLLMRMGKAAMYRQQDMAFEDALDYLRAQLTIAFSTDDIQEGVKAFFEKREPRWTGR
jgi:enoyl-CoA hydratase